MDLAPQIDAIPVPPSKTDALQQNVTDLPDVATIDDYARVLITMFGAAMLRGMGWVDGGATEITPCTLGNRRRWNMRCFPNGQQHCEIDDTCL
ncbi:hypothetical protein F4604DRAFT_1812140 [Suillus subluteus]|nr:hypothetical protein F4604DRAFT_1812140 [Suillus subluteus]